MHQNLLNKTQKDHSILLSLAMDAFKKNKLADAILFTEQAIAVAPDIMLYRRNLGELLRRTGQFDAAINSLKIAISIEPQSAENHFLLGLIYNDSCQFALAIQHYHIALSYNQTDTLIWNNLGASLEKSGDIQSAKIAYITAIQLNSKNAQAQSNLAVIYSVEGRLDEARYHFMAAIDATPNFIQAHYNLSLIKTYTIDDSQLAILESIAREINHYSIEERIRYYFAFGKALDDTKQYARAFSAYSEGNRLQYQLQPWDKTKLQALVEKSSNIFTKSFLKKASKPVFHYHPIFIIGMPRAGSTLIEQILSSHNSIYGAGELTTLDDLIQEKCNAANRPFHDWVTTLTDLEFTELGQQYLERVSKFAPDKKFIIDKMPGNFFYIGMIYRMLPNAKIIHAIRDPMDTCFSCFIHLFKEGLAFSNDLTALGNYYQLYRKTMRHWYAVLPENTIFDVHYEEMVDHYEVLSKKLLNYIGLPWDNNCLLFYKNNRIVKTASLMQVRKPIYKTSVHRWKYFENELELLRKEIGA